MSLPVNLQTYYYSFKKTLRHRQVRAENSAGHSVLVSIVMLCSWYSLAFLWLASWASGNITWPTDSQVRASFLQKRGLALYGEDNLDKLAKMKARSVSAIIVRHLAATACCC